LILDGLGGTVMVIGEIEQYYGDPPPAHFHAIHGDDVAVIGIARGLKVLSGKRRPGAKRDVIDWANPRRALLALNWVDAAAQGDRLVLGWVGGRQSVVDLSDMISRGGVFATLSDKDKFAAVRVGEKGVLIDWPEPKDDLGYPIIEIDSPALVDKVAQQHDATLLDTVRQALETLGRKASKQVASTRKPQSSHARVHRRPA
jgi:hypothetical protein